MSIALPSLDTFCVVERSCMAVSQLIDAMPSGVQPADTGTWTAALDVAPG
ncbi:hypothetical protein [Sphaerisporangium aureirubrum]|uniref:Uncharacterized protein n=1 Tax=Sphaerisporangium aureirubrum TaxID=1544736 RepID=A0ABW1NFK2_9ACTN